MFAERSVDWNLAVEKEYEGPESWIILLKEGEAVGDSNYAVEIDVWSRARSVSMAGVASM